MRIVAYFFGAAALIGGVALAVFGFLIPRRANLGVASAVEITQVYAEAQHYILLGIAAIGVAIVFVIVAISSE